MLACDDTERIRFVNFIHPSMRREDVVGQSIYAFVPADDRERVSGFLRRVLEHGETVAYESKASVDTGPEWFAIRTAPIRVDDGRIIGFTMITTDITELKRSQFRLEQSNRELENFAYVASHDLQEPLRKIQTFGDRLKATSAELPPESRDYLERMQSAATRMRRLIDDLLSFSRVGSKTQPFARVNLADIARDVLEDLEATIQQAGATVTLGALPSLEADPMQMRQLLQNLLSNALKFRQEGVPPAITVRGSTHTGQCELRVEDNGIGFDEKYLDRIFNVFQRLHGRGQYEGTGIGLAICRKIAERHGGSITARSAPGKGATFLVTLPLRQPLPK
jgi:light-regulated signal transduction histidine kinase (bacteriophytochrome)